MPEALLPLLMLLYLDCDCEEGYVFFDDDFSLNPFHGFDVKDPTDWAFAMLCLTGIVTMLAPFILAFTG